MFNFQVFPGNKGRNTVTEHILVTAFNARLIRFHPKAYHGHTSMRVEVYGCRNGMCMHESSTHLSTYIALDPKKSFKSSKHTAAFHIQNTLRLTGKYGLFLATDKCISRYVLVFSVILFVYELIKEIMKC